MKYLLGSENDFHDFVGSISKTDRVGIVTHTDVDGISSGIFLKKILESRGIKIDFIEFLNYGADVLEELSKRRDYDKLFFTDWNADQFHKGLDMLREKGDVLIIDHHPLDENLEDKSGIIKTDSGYCSSHTLFDLSKKYYNTKDFEWLVCSAIIMDYAFTDDKVFEFLKSVYPEISKEKIFDSVPGKIGRKIDNALVYYNPDCKKVYDLVVKKDMEKLDDADEIIQNEIDRWVEKFKNEAEYFPDKNLYFYYGNPEHKISRIIATKVSGEEYPNSTIVLLSDKEDKINHIGINARNQSGKIDLGKVLKKCVEGFENSTAGGHAKASGGDFPSRYLKEFKKRLLMEL